MEFIKKYKVYVICLLIIILSIISILIQNNSKIKVNNSEISKNGDNFISVYITGAIKNEGVYDINRDSRLKDLIEVAGGFKEGVDLNKINLAQKIIDGEKIDIPYLENEITIEDTVEDTINDEIEKNNKININKATKEELMELEGIGETSANNIIEYRKKNKFQHIEDIMNVKGIGKSKFEKIKELLEV